jgi:hypothetical protein
MLFWGWLQPELLPLLAVMWQWHREVQALKGGGCGVCRGGMDQAGSMCHRFRGAGDCFEARDRVVVAVVDNVDGSVDVVSLFWSVTRSHPMSSCSWRWFSVLWWWPLLCSSPCCLLFAILSLSLLLWCKQGTTSPNDSCRCLGPRSVQSACFKVVVMVERAWEQWWWVCKQRWWW